MSDNNTVLAYVWGKTKSGSSGGAPTGEAFIPTWDSMIMGFDNGWFSYNSQTGAFVSKRSFTAKITPCARSITYNGSSKNLTYTIYRNGVSIATATTSMVGTTSIVTVALERNDALTMSCYRNDSNPTSGQIPQVACGFTVEVSPE